MSFEENRLEVEIAFRYYYERKTQGRLPKKWVSPASRCKDPPKVSRYGYSADHDSRSVGEMC